MILIDYPISYDYFTQNLHYIILNIKDKIINIEKSIEKINILYKNLNKGCRNPIDKLREKDADNNYVYNDNGTLKEKFNNGLVINDLSNELLSDIKLNTKEKCYDFILNDSEGLERCCNNKNCIPDCDDYENRINTPIEVQNTENTYAIDRNMKNCIKILIIILILILQ